MILQLANINFGFTPEKQIIKNLSLSLEKQKIYAFIGSNGAGKTTLFNLITGFIRPQSGQILFYDKNLTNMQPYQINRQGVGRTFQDLRLINKLSVKKNIILAMKYNPSDKWFNALLPACFHRISNRNINQKADEIIEQFFLNDVKDTLADEISYGQQKLLTLACCVANGASLLLIDEPVAGIQPEYRNKVAMLLKQIKDQEKTIFLIEHNTDFISDIADKIFFLHEGEISDFENMEALRADKQVMEAYI